MTSFSVSTSKKEEFVDITSEVQGIVKKSGVSSGLCVVFIPHTTAGITINENADPAVCKDILKGLKVIPETGFAHSEGNSPAHIKASIIGSSVTIYIEEARLRLGTWQGVYLAEFDGPRRREVWIKLSNSNH
jgi:secondary thiamine-phosphate synthase enzyme